MSWSQYWRWLENGRSKIISAVVVTALFAAIFFAFLGVSYGPGGFGQWERTLLAYNQWRFLKGSASERDRWRSREYLVEQIKRHANAASANVAVPAQTPESIAALHEIVAPLVIEVRYSDISPAASGDIMSLLVDCHSRIVQSVYLPELIESLRTKNHSVRLAIHRTLQAIQLADYKDNALDAESELMQWVPVKEYSPGTIDTHVQAWHSWWEVAGKAR